MVDLLSVVMALLIVSGSVLCVVGGVGLLRLPDFYSRLHAAGVTDSLGAILILLGLMLAGGFSLITVKLITIVLFAYLAGPAATQALAKAAYSHGIKVEGTLRRLRQGENSHGAAD